MVLQGKTSFFTTVYLIFFTLLLFLPPLYDRFSQSLKNRINSYPNEFGVLENNSNPQELNDVVVKYGRASSFSKLLRLKYKSMKKLG